MFTALKDINKRCERNIYKCKNSFVHLGRKYETIIFCHIPKTGGQSINKMFGWCNLAEKENSLKLNVGTGHAVTDKYKFFNHFIFAFVRNPYDRLVSVYNFLKNGSQWDNHSLSPEMLGIKNDAYKLLNGANTFSDFLKQKKFHTLLEDSVLTLPQNTWIPHGADFIGKVENFTEDLTKLMGIISFEWDGKVYSVNKTKNKNNYLLTKYEKEIIYDFYKKDFELFNYKK